jgi:hypothetical protein
MTTKKSEAVYEDAIKVNTPDIKGEWKYDDADDELQAISSYIRQNSEYNSDVEIERIKFLYTKSAKKVGGKYAIGDIILRSELEKMIDDSFDYIVTVYYPVWKDLTKEHKVIQLDKLLCGVDLGTIDKPSIKKKSADSREFISSIKNFGADTVIQSSEIVHLAAERIAEKEKEDKKDRKNYVNAERAAAELD